MFSQIQAVYIPIPVPQVPRFLYFVKLSRTQAPSKIKFLQHFPVNHILRFINPEQPQHHSLRLLPPCNIHHHPNTDRVLLRELISHILLFEGTPQEGASQSHDQRKRSEHSLSQGPETRELH